MRNNVEPHLYGKAFLFYKARDYDRALSLFEQIGEKEPQNLQAVCYRIRCLLALGRLPEAEQCFSYYDDLLDATEHQKIQAIIMRARQRTRKSDSEMLSLSKNPGRLKSSVAAEVGGSKTFEVQNKRVISNDSCIVSGSVKEGIFRVGDMVEVKCPLGERFFAPILDIVAEASRKAVVRDGDCASLTLRIDPNNILVGDILKGISVPKDVVFSDVDAEEQKQVKPPIERPGELREIERLIKRGSFAKADEMLQKHLQAYPGSTGAMRLQVELCLNHNSPFYDPQQGLQIIQSVYQSAKVEDPAVTWAFAVALAETGDKDMGLHILERSYTSMMNAESLEHCAKRIHDFRIQYGFGDVYEITDKSGEILLELHNISEIVSAIDDGQIPESALWRCNRVGPWERVEQLLASSPLIANKIREPEEKRSSNWLLIAVAIASFAAFCASVSYQLVMLYYAL